MALETRQSPYKKWVLPRSHMAIMWCNVLCLPTETQLIPDVHVHWETLSQNEI